MPFIDPPWESVDEDGSGSALEAALAFQVALPSQAFGNVYQGDPFPGPGFEQDYVFLSFLIAGEIPWVYGESGPRVRSLASETIGSLLEQTSVQAVENTLDESFFLDVQPDPTLLTPFVEALDTQAVSVRYPLPVQSREFLSTTRARTNLGRIADTFPAGVLTRAIDTPSIGTDTGTVTQWVQLLISQWEAQYPWLRFEPLPDLRYPVVSGDYSGDQGVLSTEALVIPQQRENRLAIRDILDRLLTLIPGVIRQTATGTLEIIVFNGPDAMIEPALELGPEDVISTSMGRADPSSIYNSARVSSQGSEFQDEQQLNEPSFAVASWFSRTILDPGSGNAPDPIPDDRVEFPFNGHEMIAQGNIGTQPFAEGVLSGGGAVEVEWVMRVYSAQGSDPQTVSNLWEEGSDSGTVNLTLNGPAQSVSVTGNVGGFLNFTCQWSFRLTEEGVQVSTLTPYGGSLLGVPYIFASVIEFDVVGTAWAPRALTVEGEFSLANGDDLPGSAGGNALAVSEAEYGPRQLQVHTDMFALSPVQAQELAQALVLQHINPRVARTVEQSWWGGYRVKPDHVGRLVQLPNSEVGRVESRQYSDDFTALSMSSEFTIVLTTPAVDTSGLLLGDDGSLLAFDSGDLIGVS